MQTVLSFLKFRGKHQQRLESIFKGTNLIFADLENLDSIVRNMRVADVVLYRRIYDPTQFDTPKLKWIHAELSGINALAKQRIIDKPYTVTSAAGRSAPVLAEHALFLMLSICYRADKLREAQLAGEWGFPDDGKRRGLNGKSVLIIGMGKTGHELAKYCVALGMKTSTYRRKNEPCLVSDVTTYSAANNDELDLLLPEVDIVALAASLNDTSFNILNRRRLRSMKKGAAIVNVARGRLIDEVALAELISEGHISGYGSDVFRKEPLPADHMLRQLENVYISPHKTPQMPDRVSRSLDIIEENYRRLLAGEELLNRLMPEDLYTKTDNIPKLLP